LKFLSGNQSDKDNAIISKSDAEKHAIQLSKSLKLLLSASALENTDNIKKISDSKLQKCLLDSNSSMIPILACVNVFSSHSTINW
jgi:hypothetical protein